jgi:hypothetical protein
MGLHPVAERRVDLVLDDRLGPRHWSHRRDHDQEGRDQTADPDQAAAHHV